MPSHKALKGIVHSFVGSFASDVNYIYDDYVIGHIIRAGWRTGETELRANLLTGGVSKSSLATEAVAVSIKGYVSNFPDLVQRSQSSLDFIKSAELIITVDPKVRRKNITTKVIESPYTCTVRIVDDRGKEYSYTQSGWWIPEQ